MSIELAEIDAKTVWKAYLGRLSVSEFDALAKEGLADPEGMLSGAPARLRALAAVIEGFESAACGKLKVEAVSIGAIQRPEQDDASELLRDRFLCRGGGLLLVGPSGIGKSSLGLQCALSWGMGRECLGIEPARPLRSLIIQAENDEGDLAEMRDGVADGLGLSQRDRQTAFDSVFVARETTKAGTQFWDGVVRPLLAANPVDLVWIDPVLAFLGGSVNEQREVGGFLRNGLAPLLTEFNCGAVAIHHTNKPPSGKEKPDWSGGDFAYLGSGSAEFANWSRAVLAIRSVGSHDVFELRAGKRGGRLHWRDADGQPTYARHIAHAREPGRICWRYAEAAEVPTTGRPAKGATAEEVRDLLPPDGMSHSAWRTAADEELGLGQSAWRRRVDELRKSKRVFKSKTTGLWLRQGQ